MSNIRQCRVCKKEDDLSNLVTVGREAKDGYAHSRCIKQHNRTVAKNLRALDASMIASEILDHDLDATDPYVVKQFLRRQRPESLLGGRCPTADEIAIAAREKREHNQQQWIFERIEEEIRHEPGKTGATDAFLAEIADDLKQLVLKDEDISHFASRMLTLQVAWRKDREAFEAANDDYQRSQENA
ncbi:hypothetical protein I6F21_14200 [Bradyrhizobium sp. NBAIM03]|uniref:hypothetical protein n=1 Tax=Bradyrhizobium sp. NBAIM03 TaxID=2793816 RepID=UPI001CD2EEDA|nr:hypothetical protein [Bradyrhizobium sp. NBAIM03]MCA1533714.1 hypothetical protein [Bradyrhizobium sp. NBAIM03]